jgi:hypothetical protein
VSIVPVILNAMRLALSRHGLSGKLTMVDGETGKRRTIIDIERVASLTVKEGPNGPRFVKWRRTVVESDYSPETVEPASDSREVA